MKIDYFDQDIKEVLFDADAIREKVRELGDRISRDYAGKEIVAVCVLRGSLVFTADLIREINLPMEIDTMVISSYGASTKSSGVVRIIKDLQTDITGKHVLLIEDIVDTGLTLDFLIRNLESREPASVKACVFLDKPERREKEVRVDYKGFDIPNEFVVGYGIDFAQRCRNYPAVAVLKPEAYEK